MSSARSLTKSAFHLMNGISPDDENGETVEMPQFYQEEDSSSDSASLAEDRFGLFIFLVAFGAAMLICLMVVVREFYWRKYGVDMCPSISRNANNGASRAARAHQLVRDRELAQELQMQLNEEMREQERLAKREERREWYLQYLKPFTVEAKQEDFFYAREGATEHNGTDQHLDAPSLDSSESTALESSSSEGGSSRYLFTSPRSRFETEESEGLRDQVLTEDAVVDLELGTSSQCQEPTTCEDTIPCDAQDDEAHLYLKLPVICSKNGKNRCVDAHCAICLGEYEAGDNVVWSGLQCQHAFHNECILPWLSKGKKRCPICRHWFVPGTKIDDQKAALLEQQSNASEPEEVSGSRRALTPEDAEPETNQSAAADEVEAPTMSIDEEEPSSVTDVPVDLEAQQEEQEQS